MLRYFIGNLMTGDRIQTLPNVISGPWAQKLNTPDDLAVTVPLSDPATRRLGLRESAATGKAFLAASEGDRIVASGPIWFQDYDDDSKQLTLSAQGIWSYFDSRVLLPLLAGRNPADRTTDTRFLKANPTDPDYPWPTDTRKSLQGIGRALVAQAQAETGGNVPVILPAEIAGDSERDYKGTDLPFVGERLRQLTQVSGGPDIMFPGRFTAGNARVEWPMMIGTPTQPLLFSKQEPVFYLTTAKSSMSNLKIKTDGTKVAGRAFVTGGRSSSSALVALSTDPTLTNQGWPLLDSVDSTHSTVSEIATLQDYANEDTRAGRTPSRLWTFTHDASQSPLLGSFNVGDFCRIRVGRNHPYLDRGEYRMRLLAMSGEARSKKIRMQFSPEVI